MSIPSYRDEYKKVIIEALKHPYVSTSSKDAIKTGNGYQSINLDDTRTFGGRGDREFFLKNLNLIGRSVIDIGANLGEMSRLARKYGASLVDGYEYDPFFVETGRMINGVMGTTRVSLFQGDATNPSFYEGLKYDVALAFSVFVYIRARLADLAKVTDVMVFETHTLDHGLAMYTNPIVRYFPAFRILGYSNESLDLKKNRAILVFGKTDDAVRDLVNSTKVRTENYFSHSYFETYGKPAKGQAIEDYIKRLKSPDGSHLRNKLNGLNSDYFAMFVFGYGDYLDHGRQVTDSNPFYCRLKEAILAGRIDKKLAPLLKNEEHFRAKVMAKFIDFDSAVENKWHLIAPIAIRPDENGKQIFKKLDGTELRADNIDGHHRFFVAQLLGRETTESLIRLPLKSEKIVRTNYTLQENRSEK